MNDASKEPYFKSNTESTTGDDRKQKIYKSEFR